MNVLYTLYWYKSRLNWSQFISLRQTTKKGANNLETEIVSALFYFIVFTINFLTIPQRG